MLMYDRRHTTNGGPCLYYKLTSEPKGSGELKMGVIDLVLELYMLKNSLLHVPKKAFFASSHAYMYFSNKKYQNDVKKIIRTEPIISRDDI